MGWFGGGSSEPASPSERGFSDGAAGFSDDGPNMYAGGGGAGSGGGLSDFQEFSMNLQQQVLVQQVITELSHKAFEKCCATSTRDSQLTGKEVACVNSITNKWLDANEFMAGRLQRKQQQAQGGQQFG